MTLVNIETLRTSLVGNTGVNATLTATYWSGYAPYVQVNGEDVVFPVPITVQFVAGVEATPIDMVPTDGLSCVRWQISSPVSPATLDLYTSVPNQPNIDFGALPVVDRGSFVVNEESIAGWSQAWLELQAAVVEADGYADDAAASAAVALAARDETVVGVVNLGDKTGVSALTQAETQSSYLKLRLIGNATLNPAAGVAGQAYSCTLEIAQDAVGSRTLVLANVGTAYFAPIPLSSTANAVDIVHLMWSGTAWRAFLAGTQMGIPAGWVV